MNTGDWALLPTLRVGAGPSGVSHYNTRYPAIQTMWATNPCNLWGKEKLKSSCEFIV